ncbi:zinc metalloproteinase nas-4 isoform X2 [Hydra vulgaris]|uniref:Metalloendopeptidase n=1 Tax=Hydra vulgaris TaxID=6087 RepID=A0ABM4DIQ8_HYDVU
MNITVVFFALLGFAYASLFQDIQRSLAKKVLKEVVDENSDEMDDFIRQVFKKELQENEEKEIKQISESFDEKLKKKVFQKTEIDEKLSENADGVHILEAIKDFDEKMKVMEPKDITNAATFIEKQEEALAEQKAEDNKKMVAVMEGDIIRTDHENAIIANDTNKRNLRTYEKWGLLVAYQLPQTIKGDGRMQRAINEAMKELSAVSCIKFIKRKSDGSSQYNVDLNGQTESYLQFIQGYGCYSYVGKQGGSQVISIGTNCEYKGTVMHEILHALGFYHEQSRLDRDDFIRVKFENVRSGLENNFRKYDVGQADTLGFDYDLDSIMHYGESFFTKNGQSTIEVLGKKRSIGQRLALSETDKMKLNKLYCSPQYLEEYKNLKEQNFEKISKNVYAHY